MPITIKSIGAPFYPVVDKSVIDITVDCAEYGLIPMTVGPQDTTAYTLAADGSEISNAQIYAKAAAGEYGAVAAFAPPPVAQLAATLAAAASDACASVVAQVYPDAAHQAAFQNAASIVNGNGGSAPSAAPMAAKFAALAAVYGLSASAFATLVVAMQGASFDLSAALATLSAAASVATTPAALATALAAFETALAGVVAEINAAGLPSAIAAPAPIAIPGVNA